MSKFDSSKGFVKKKCLALRLRELKVEGIIDFPSNRLVSIGQHCILTLDQCYYLS